MTSSHQEWTKSTCAYCGVGCGIEARPTLSGKLEIRGDKSHPSNYGKLCTKGIALGETVAPIGRLTQPKLKINEMHEPIDWTTATQLVADKFKQAIDEYGPDSVAFYVSGQLLTEDYYVANKLMKGFIGSANIDSNSRLCMASSVVGHKRAFGTDTVPVCYEDLEHTDLVIITGSNLAWCHPVLFQRLRAAKQANPNLKVVVVDPRRRNQNLVDPERCANDSSARYHWHAHRQIWAEVGLFYPACGLFNPMFHVRVCRLIYAGRYREILIRFHWCWVCYWNPLGF